MLVLLREATLIIIACVTLSTLCAFLVAHNLKRKRTRRFDCSLQETQSLQVIRIRTRTVGHFESMLGTDTNVYLQSIRVRNKKIVLDTKKSPKQFKGRPRFITIVDDLTQELRSLS